MRFVLDVMLGKLAVYLRTCGHDTVYAPDRGIEEDAAIRRLARREDRVLLTRDVALADRTMAAIRLEGLAVEDQLRELRAESVPLELDEPRFCGRCNGELRRREDDPDEDTRLPDDRPVWSCQVCGQHFWKGSHWSSVRRTLASLDEPNRP